MLFCAELQAEENKKKNYRDMDSLFQLFFLLPRCNEFYHKIVVNEKEELRVA